MQDRPDKATLLDAVARFLATDVKEALRQALTGPVTDPAIGFRVLIAANLVQMVATEERVEDEQDRAQIGRLQAILGEESPHGANSIIKSERISALRVMEAEIARGLRDGSLSEDQRSAAREHVRATLREKLAVTNARFDLSPDIE